MHRHTEAKTDKHARGKGERALRSSVTSISHLVPYLQNLVCCLKDILHNQCQSKGKDSMAWLGQGQVCPCFYFGHMDDLFKPCKPCDFNNIHSIPARSASCAWVCWCVLHVLSCRCGVCTFTHICWHSRYHMSTFSCSLLCTTPLCCSRGKLHL